MRETQFIQQNKEKWEAFEKSLKEPKPDPDKLSNLLIQVTDDLAYSRTFYPNRSIRVYLNNLSQKIYSTIYKSKRNHKRGFLFFWKEELPILVYEARKELLFSLAFFLLSAAIGVVSSKNDPAFAKIILGENYVQETLRNIEKGDPMGIYKSGDSDDFFFMITYNNVRVAFTTFLLGVFFAVGSIFILISNGIMVGTFQYFFIERDLFKESFLAIWLHGTLEISSIVIAAGAGITMGKGLLFPGTFSRMQSFLISARRGLKILIGIVPILIFAALIEGFLTRYTDTPDAIRLAIIIFSLLFIILYFVVFPYLKCSKGYKPLVNSFKLPETLHYSFDNTEVKSTGEHIKDLIALFRINGLVLIKNSLIISFVYSILYVLLSESLFIEVRNKDLFFITQLMNYKGQPLLAFLNTIASTFMIVLVFNKCNRLIAVDAIRKSFKENLMFSLKVFCVMALIHSILFINPALAVFMLLGFTPLFALLLFSISVNNFSIGSAITDSYNLISAAAGKAYYLFFVLLLNIVIIFFLLSSPLTELFFEFLGWNLPFDETLISSINLFASVFINQFTFLLLLPVLLIGTGLCYFTLKEIKEAPSLMNEINNFGKKTR